MRDKAPPKKRVRLKAKRAVKVPKAPPPKKKPAKKRAKKPSKPMARALDVRGQDLPKTHAVRQQAMADFITDPESRDAGYHYGRLDREYRAHVTATTFEHWAREDNWTLRREAYWAEAQRMLLEKTRDHTVNVLASSMQGMNELREYALEWCDPIRDSETQEVLRYPEQDDEGNPHRYANKPMLAVRPKSYEAAVAAFLALDDAVQKRRDEILRMTGQGDSASNVGADPVVALLKFSREDLRDMAQALVQRRQPELVTHAIEVKEEPHDE